MEQTCLHCAGPSPHGDFCCGGCESVYALLHDGGLDRYYELRNQAIPPAAPLDHLRNYDWLDAEAKTQELRPGERCSLQVDLQGIHCAACVWLIEELARRQKGGLTADVNPTIGTMTLRWQKGEASLDHFAEELGQLGYLVGRAQKTAPRALRSLAFRLGLSVALTMNVMLIAIAFYAGLGEGSAEDRVARVFGWVMFGLASLVVAIGGSYFGARAIAALRRGLWHLDVPIALGIFLAYGSALADPRGRGYLDTLSVFVTLMLLGRYLQERVLERNRGRLLSEEDDALRIRRVRDGRVAWIGVDQIAIGDELMVAPGELFPVDCVATQPGMISTDWIDGEPQARPLVAGQPVGAGSFCAGTSAIRAQALTIYATGSLAQLLRRDEERPTQRGFWDRFARVYVGLVLGIAALGGLVWLIVDPLRAPEVTVALLVVTCPCAIGIVTPLARELVGWQLRRVGLYLRRDDLLDRVLAVKKVLFDKTGTLTLGELELVDPQRLALLSERDRDVLYTMVTQSNHPVARAFAKVLERHHPVLLPLQVNEIPSMGIECVLDGATYRLGRPGWIDATQSAVEAETLFSRDGALIDMFRIDEHIRPAARQEVARLRAAGYDVWLISGDRKARVERAAERLGIDPDNARAELSAIEKETLVEVIGHHDTLYVGDGGNDCHAASSATASLAVNVERPLLAARADGFVLGETAPPIMQLLTLAQKLRRQVRMNLVLAVVYNSLAVLACLLGWMTPLRAAVAMPVSSLAILFFTLFRLRARRSTERHMQSVGIGELAWKS